MNVFWVELSGENLALADAELAAVASLGGGNVDVGSPVDPGLRIRVVHLAQSGTEDQVLSRLALARRVLRPLGSTSDPSAGRALEQLGATHTAVRFRIRSANIGDWKPMVRRFQQAGGVVELDRPQRIVHLWPDRSGQRWSLEEIQTIDRSAYERRRPSRLPFRRPVTLPPRLGRVLVNLARVRPGDWVVDPFVGTGALLAESALVGAHACGVDHDPTMVRGALRNLAFVGAEAAELRVGEATEAWRSSPGRPWNALVTDPPYGRASPAGTETPSRLVERALAVWTPHLGPKARIALALPAGAELRLDGWEAEWAIAHRAHRSLTREFRTYVRTEYRPASRAATES